MVYGPCGGVRDDRRCEIGDRTCPFCLDAAAPVWRGRSQMPRPFGLPDIVIDVRPSIDDPAMLRRTAAQLSQRGYGALLGEHLDDPAPDRPHIAAAAVVAQGVAVVATVTPRDRSELECTIEIDALIGAGVLAIHCVTGDHPAARLGADFTATFSMDGTRLAELARRRGAFVTVAESPASPPVEWRPDRVLSKQHAGADAVILNHAGSVGDLCRFAQRCRDIGVTMPLVAPVPVVTDHRSAHALTQFPGLCLPPGLLEAVLHDRDPHRAGIAAAVDIGRALLASGEFRHLNLSGSASGSGLAERAEVMTAVADSIRSG